jgi:stage II sporulation protein D
VTRVLGAVLAIAALASCRPGEPVAPAPPTPRPPVTGLPRAEPTVRIGITVDSAAALVGARTDFTIRAPGNEVIARGRAGETWTFSAGADGRISGRGPSGVTQPRAGPLRVTPEQAGGLIIGARPYRGEALIISRAAGQVTAVNLIELEAYLLGVVPREIGRLPAAMIEAMKAQAVAARTYAIGNLASRASLGFDFYATVQDQVYGGLTDEDTIVSRAVRETRGEILTHGGVPILAYYSSTCGGVTAAIEESWPWRAPLPYQRSKTHPKPPTHHK